ncbi:MAG: coiled-coil protein, partial [bacterium]
MSAVATDAPLDEILDKKERLNARANTHRDQRDALNNGTKDWARKRDELNAKVRGLVDKANAHRATRDEMNKQVQAQKEIRDTLNREAAEARTKLNEARAQRQPDLGPSVARLKKELKRLEFEQQTKPLTIPKERELIEKMQALQREIQEKEKLLAADEATREAYQTFSEVKAKAEEAHASVTKLAEGAQREHDAMVKLFEEADKIRKEAD